MKVLADRTNQGALDYKVDCCKSVCLLTDVVWLVVIKLDWDAWRHVIRCVNRQSVLYPPREGHYTSALTIKGTADK